MANLEQVKSPRNSLSQYSFDDNSYGYTFIMCQAGALNEILLYFSLYFKKYRRDYYDLLTHVRETGDWEKWLSFFFNGVANSDVVKIQTETGCQAGSVLRAHQALKNRLIINLRGMVS